MGSWSTVQTCDAGRTCHGGRAVGTVQVMELLDRLYHILDNLALRWQLFKVETIGCTHMVVGNLQPALPDHVARACWFALDAHKATQSVPVCAADPLLGYVPGMPLLCASV